MTDKQIIIDGVDVSGCKNFRPDVETTQVTYTNACSIGVWQRWYSNLEPSCIMSCSCKYNPNCYYKQKEKYKNALKGIREIANDGYNNGQTSYATFQCEKIIDIINEVLNA